MTRQIDIGPLADAVLRLELSTSRGVARLSDFLGHQWVIFFYPKDDTPGCTVEAIDFSDRKSVV